MEKLLLKFIGVDSWNRPVYENKQGKLFKDTSLKHSRNINNICTTNSFSGEPDTPLCYIKRYENVLIKIIE